MSALNDLHRRLYSHNNDDLINREVSPDDYSDNKKEKKETTPVQNKILQEQSKKTENKTYFQEDPIDNRPSKIDQSEVQTIVSKLNQKKIKIAGIILAAFLVISGSIIGYIKYKQLSFDQENVVIEFQGNQEVKSGEDFEYKLLIHNNNRVSLKNTQIKIEYPEELTPVMMSYMKENTSNSFFINIGDIKSRETKDYQLEFGVFSPRGNQVYLNTDFYYEPSNFSSVFNKEGNHSIDVKGSVVDFSLVTQQEVSSGETLKLIAVLNNTTAIDFNNLILEIEYPDDFSLSQTELTAVSGSENRFKVPELKSNTKLEIEILGSFASEVDSIKKLTGIIGSSDDKGVFSKISLSEESIKVIPSRIAISQEIIEGVDIESQTTYMDSNLKYRIDFKNNSTSPLLDLVLKEDLESDLIIGSSVRAKFGYYNQTKQEIIWKASDVPALKILNPGESGSVEFSFKLKDDLDLDSDDTNQALVTQAKISSLNIDTAILSDKEISSGEKEIKINTKLDISVFAQFEGGVFKNSGPMPFESGKETTLTAKVALKNNFNKINSPDLTIKLPSGIIWKDSFQRSSGTVTFNERSNELKWELNSLNSQVGYKYPLEELIFQIGVAPEASQINKDFPLINSVDFEGFETFVEKEIIRNLKAFNSSIIGKYDF